jgi:hypothetical protein
MKIVINPELADVNIENPDEMYGTAQQYLEAMDKVYIKSSMQDNLPVIVNEELNFLEKAVFMAYAYNRGLVIDPNDWWTMVVQQVTRYISDNGEPLREVFVDYDGKGWWSGYGTSYSSLRIRKDESVLKSSSFMGSLSSANADGSVSFRRFRNSKPPSLSYDSESWVPFIRDMYYDIKHHIEFDFTKYLKKDEDELFFSTSTPAHNACLNALLMKGVDDFFGYKFITMCGIPYFEMLGVEEDYVKLVSKTQELMNLPGGIGKNLTPYLKRVTTIFEKFLETFRGNVDEDFWNNIYNYKSRGSGSPSITGWVKNMVCYSEEDGFLGEKEISEFSNLPSSYSTVEFKWVDNGLEREYMKLRSGLIAVEVINYGEAYKPVAGWIVYDDNKRCNKGVEFSKKT